MKKIINYVATIRLPSGYRYDKLVGANTKKEALDNVTSWQKKGKVETIRKCTKKDIGTFFQGVRQPM